MIIESDLFKDGRLFKQRYIDADNFKDLSCKAGDKVYGLCFCNDKLVIVFDSELRSWGFVSGSIEEGETIEECLKREALEQANIKIIKSVPIGYRTTIGSDGEDSRLFSICCQAESLGSFMSKSSSTVIEIKLINPIDCKKYFYWGRISDHIIEQAVRAKEWFNK